MESMRVEKGEKKERSKKGKEKERIWGV